MVKFSLASVFLLAALSACSGIRVEQDYPNDFSRDERSNNSGAVKKASKVETITLTGPAKQDSGKHDEASYNWPIKDAPALLEKTPEKEIVTAYNTKGEPVWFAVLEEYTSASGKRCKKYYVNLDLKLACFNPHWYPVRSFEE